MDANIREHKWGARTLGGTTCATLLMLGLSACYAAGSDVRGPHVLWIDQANAHQIALTSSLEGVLSVDEITQCLVVETDYYGDVVTVPVVFYEEPSVSADGSSISFASGEKYMINQEVHFAGGGGQLRGREEIIANASECQGYPEYFFVNPTPSGA